MTIFVDFLDLPKRASKPREIGITHVLDDGLGSSQARNLLEGRSEWVDLIKLGWGTGYVTNGLKQKINHYRQNEIPCLFGGTLFEISLQQDKLSDYIETLKQLELNHLEISTGSIDISHSRKCKHIEELSNDFTILSEVGRKSPDNIMPPKEWIDRIKTEQDAGAWKIIMEGRASGRAGVYRRDGEVRFGLIDEICAEVDQKNLIFEAPQKEQQLWFINRFGTNVNLGNIRFEKVIPVETLRQGLRGDTINFLDLS